MKPQEATSIGRQSTDTSGPIPNKRLVFHRFCPYHVVTLIDDCRSCQERCIPLQNIFGAEIESRIPKELRDELFEYLYGNEQENPMIKIRELLGIPLRVDIKPENPLLAPSRLQYLSAMSEADERRHWIIYYKGYMAWRSMGDLKQGGFLVEEIPPHIEKCITYYQAHTAVMEGRLKPEQALEKIDATDVNIEDHPSQLEFENHIEAAKILTNKAVKMVHEVSSGSLEEYNEKANEIDNIESNCRDILEKIEKIKSNSPSGKKQDQTQP